MYDPYSQFKTLILRNGLKVLHLEIDRPFIVLAALVHAGSREDPQGKEGLAHFVEHLVSRNIPEHPVYSENRARFERSGGIVAFGTTSLLGTWYEFKLPLEEMDFGLSVFGNMLFGARIENEIPQQRSVILREYQRKYSSPIKLVTDFFDIRAFYRKHRGAHSTPMGTPETFLPLNKGDFQCSYDRYYVPKNVTIVSGGGVSAAEIEKVFEDSALGVKKEGETRFRKVERMEASPENGSAQKVIKMSDFLKEVSETSAIKKVYALPSDTEVAADAITHVLRKTLMEEIREKLSLTYGISVNHQITTGANRLSIEVETAPESLELVRATIEKNIASLTDMRSSFEEGREMILKRLRLRDETLAKIVDLARNEVCNIGRVKSLGEDKEEIEAVTWDRIASAIDFMNRPEHQAELLLVK